ncbi:MAG TPA: histidine phosphatase family protein [Victivallales bacterium]|nr:histidine phosphatase family protein [Victivallales bacterium]HPO91217.1 histidine phosphatase family protein [Victivallales bacterium]HRR05913.1 histidine phosphatase family protein [Victivallales bacterium]HRR29147.1 histidine phosphatase family protein [Victivallales bacterium]HRU02130.1 histidine phosphatase family protein [Victivallales bacterium]
MKILLIRHAEMAGDPFVKPLPPVKKCLSKKGIRQAKKLGKKLSTENIDIAFSSPYGRALQTAEIALTKKIPIKILDFLHEWMPDTKLSNLPSTKYEKIQKMNSELYAEQTWKTELGEGTFDMYARICPPFLKELEKLGIKAACGGYLLTKRAEKLNIAVFAHGGTLNILLSFILELRPFPVGRFSFLHTGIAKIKFSEKKNIFYPSLEIE